MLLTSTELISKSWDDYLKNWSKWLIFSLLIFLPSFVLMLSGSFGAYLNTYLPATTLVTNVTILLLFLASLFLGFWTYLAMVHATLKAHRNGKTDNWKDHYVATLYKIWPALYSSFFAGVFIFLGMIFFLIPGIIFSIWYAFVIFCVIADDEEGFKALASSKKLVSGRWWTVLWLLAFPSLFFMVSGGIINAILLTMVNVLRLNPLADTLISNVISGLVNAAVAPIIALVAVNLFNNLKSNPFRERPAILSHEPPME